MASMCGVRMCGLPSAWMVSARCWSVQIQRIFGFSGTRVDTLQTAGIQSVYRKLCRAWDNKGSLGTQNPGSGWRNRAVNLCSKPPSVRRWLREPVDPVDLLGATLGRYLRPQHSSLPLTTINRPRVNTTKWKNIIAHHSATGNGNAKIFDAAHRRRGMGERVWPITLSLATAPNGGAGR